MREESGFIIDGLTNSILNTISGDSFETDVHSLTKPDLKSITKTKGWKFLWRHEFNDLQKETYKLTIQGNPEIIQGLISVSYEEDHIFMHLLESAPFNLGKTKLYEGVPGNLVAFACKMSFQRGYEGFVAFISKTRLIKHYEQTLGAIHIGKQRMIIPNSASNILVTKYFKTK